MKPKKRNGEREKPGVNTSSKKGNKNKTTKLQIHPSVKEK